MYKKKYVFLLILFLSLLLIVNRLFAAEKDSKNPNPDDGLARVAIINIINMSKNPAVEWVTTSLPEAIFKSMEQKFEFKRSESDTTQKIADAVLAERMKDPNNKVDPKAIQSFHSRTEVEKIALQSKSDIIIYGGFVLNETESKTEKDPKTGKPVIEESLQVNVFVYHVSGKKIIGTASVENKIDGSMFEAIDKVAAQIVNDIYKFALSLSGDSKEDKEKIRIMVLVPTWKSTDEEKKAKNEIEEMRKYLGAKYQAKFLTLDEFFEAQKVPPKTREEVLELARAKKKNEIIQWLGKMGVPDAFIVLVENNKVNITPVVAGKVEKETNYNSNARPEDKFKAFETVSKQSGMAEKKKEEKLTISKKAVEEISKPSYSGMLWRDAVLPGWGHQYMQKDNFYLYYGYFGAVTVNFGIAIVDAITSANEYADARGDFDNLYHEANKNFSYATMSGFLFLASYAAAITDALFHDSADKNATFVGRLWRNAVLPGWGNYYSNHAFADIYSGVAIGLAGLFVYNEISLNYARSSYEEAESDFDSEYESFNEFWSSRATYLSLYAGNLISSVLEATLQNYKPAGSDLAPKLWRSAVLPGWGSESRRIFYHVNFFSYSLIFFSGAAIQAASKYDLYSDSTSDFDNAYLAYQEEYQRRNLWLMALSASYFASISDVLISHFDRDRAPTLWGKIWRNLAIPGWGQLKQQQDRGSLYLNLFFLSALSSTVAIYQYSSNHDTYLATTSKFDLYYDVYNESYMQRNVWLSALVGVYLVSLADILIEHFFFSKSPAVTSPKTVTAAENQNFFRPGIEIRNENLADYELKRRPNELAETQIDIFLRKRFD